MTNGPTQTPQTGQTGPSGQTRELETGQTGQTDPKGTKGPKITFPTIPTNYLGPDGKTQTRTDLPKLVQKGMTRTERLLSTQKGKKLEKRNKTDQTGQRGTLKTNILTPDESDPFVTYRTISGRFILSRIINPNKTNKTEREESGGNPWILLYRTKDGYLPLWDKENKTYFWKNWDESMKLPTTFPNWDK